MAAFAAAAHGVPETEVVFRDDRVFIGNESLGFGELARALHPGAGPALRSRVLQDAEDHLGPRQGHGPAVLLFRLRRGLRGGR